MTLYLDPRPKDRLLQFGRELIADGFLQDPHGLRENENTSTN